MRSYWFKLKNKKEWCFLPTSSIYDPSMNDPPVLPIEKWKVGSITYCLLLHRYTKKQVSEFIGNHTQHIKNLQSIMKGPDIYSVMQGNTILLTIWKPPLLDDHLELQTYYGNKDHCYIKHDVSFEEIKKKILEVLEITKIDDTTSLADDAMKTFHIDM